MKYRSSAVRPQELENYWTRFLEAGISIYVQNFQATTLLPNGALNPIFKIALMFSLEFARTQIDYKKGSKILLVLIHRE